MCLPLAFDIILQEVMSVVLPQVQALSAYRSYTSSILPYYVQ
jgi:hypothetical protein